jgi:small subunit ribosomal protein S1
MNQKNKRPRAPKNVALAEEVIDRLPNDSNDFDVAKFKKEHPVENSGNDWYDEDGNFMWAEYEATCPSILRKPNPHIKTKNGDKVYSRASYAQQLYDMMEGHVSEQNLKTQIAEGSIYEGKVYAINHEWITVDIGYRELIYVKYDREPDFVKALTIGEETAVLITTLKPNTHVVGSISGGIKQKVFTDLRNTIETEDTAWIGKVSHMIENGGYIVRIQGIDCFMPGSLAGINKLHDFNSIVGEEIYVVPVSFSPERGTIVVSHRKYLQALIPNAIADLRENIDAEYTGFVTGTAKYGVFVEFNDCLTGMIHTNDLDEDTMKLFRSREIKPGDEISFKVKDIVSNTKITLTQKINDTINPWLTIASRYNIPATVVAEVKSKKEYGLFVTIEEGVVGLLHISEIGEDTMSVFKPGDKITVQITRIESETNKVFLKMPE